MPTMTISLDGVALKDIALTQPRTTLGRRAYNDIVIDNLAVSGEHAVFVRQADGVELIDLNSTNGTYVNGKAIVLTLLKPGDVVEIGRYQIRLTPEPLVAALQPPTIAAAAADLAPVRVADASATPTRAAPRIRILSGAATGREMPLTKPVTTLGKPGIAVAAISQRADGYTFNLIDGHSQPLVNGKPVGHEPVALHHNDVITLAGIEMQFLC